MTLLRFDISARRRFRSGVDDCNLRYRCRTVDAQELKQTEHPISLTVLSVTAGNETTTPAPETADERYPYPDTETCDPADDVLRPLSGSDSVSTASSITIGPRNETEDMKVPGAPKQLVRSMSGKNGESDARSVSSFVSCGSQRTSPEGLIIQVSIKTIQVPTDIDTR